MRTLAFVLAAIVSLAVMAAGCGHRQTPPADYIVGTDMPVNLYCAVHEHADGTGACLIYRGAQPTAAGFRALHDRLGVVSDIKLNLAIEGRDVLPDGVEEMAHPFLPAGPVDHDDIQAALDDLVSSRKPAYLHCTRGQDRTGLMIALYRVKVQHVLASSAWGEWLHYGRDPSLVMLSHAFERETGFSP